MSTSDNVRGRPFEPGNPGRPRGAKNKITRFLDQLADEQAENIVRKVLELAEAGDVSCMRMVLDRLWPPRKGQPIDIALPPLKTPADVLPALATIWHAVAEGLLSPEEAHSLASLMDRSIRIIELEGFEKRVDALEESAKQAEQSAKLPIE